MISSDDAVIDNSILLSLLLKSRLLVIILPHKMLQQMEYQCTAQNNAAQPRNIDLESIKDFKRQGTSWGCCDDHDVDYGSNEKMSLYNQHYYHHHCRRHHHYRHHHHIITVNGSSSIRNSNTWCQYQYSHHYHHFHDHCHFNIVFVDDFVKDTITTE